MSNDRGVFLFAWEETRRNENNGRVLLETSLHLFARVFYSFVSKTKTHDEGGDNYTYKRLNDPYARHDFEGSINWSKFGLCMLAYPKTIIYDVKYTTMKPTQLPTTPIAEYELVNIKGRNS